MKKTGLLAGVSLFSILSLSLVSAESIREGMQTFISWIVDSLEPVFEVVLGPIDGFILFEKILLAVIILLIIYVALKKVSIFEDNPAVLWIVDIVVTILGVRFIDFVWVNTILLQYGLLAIALTSFLPLVIFFFFLHNSNLGSTMRKIGWIFFLVVFIGLWTTYDKETYGWVYLVTGLASLIFLLFDGTIHYYLAKQQMERDRGLGINRNIMQLERQIADIQDAVIRGIAPYTDRNRARRDIKALRKRVKLMRRHGYG